MNTCFFLSKFRMWFSSEIHWRKVRDTFGKHFVGKEVFILKNKKNSKHSISWYVYLVLFKFKPLWGFKSVISV